MKENKLQKKIAQIIEKFVADNYGISETNCPSWDIDSLAFEIANKLTINKKASDE